MEKTFVYNGNKYTLTYTLDIIRGMEASGFSLEELDTKRATNIPILFAGALMAKHKNLKEKEIETMYKAMPKKRELISMLRDMYVTTIKQLIEEPEETEKNPVEEICW